MSAALAIAGPNGAGKTTFASEYLAADERPSAFVNADEILRDLPPGARSDLKAGRLMLARVDALAAAGADFAIETTLATLTYAQKIPLWQARGYRVVLIYLGLPSVEDSLARVRKRVESGGHGIPEDAIRRRFGKSAAYFETIYKPLADAWYMRENSDGTVMPVALGERSTNQEAERREIEAVLERAAYKATHGTREERAGRFLPKGGHRAAQRPPKPPAGAGRVKSAS